MGSFQHSKRSDSKRCTVEVRRGIFIENLTVFLFLRAVVKYSHTNSYNFAMTLISQDDHLTAGAWAACVLTCHLHDVFQQVNVLEFPARVCRELYVPIP